MTYSPSCEHALVVVFSGDCDTTKHLDGPSSKYDIAGKQLGSLEHMGQARGVEASYLQAIWVVGDGRDIASVNGVFSALHLFICR